MNYSGLNCRTRFVFICLVFAALFSTITAAPWEVDPTFANNGIYTFPTGKANSSIRSMVVVPDDRVIMAGYSSDGPLRNSRFPTLERLLPNGMPDPSFGVGGVIVFPFTGEFESVTLQPDGKILVAGSAFGRGGIDLDPLGPSHGCARSCRL
jgi:hypothetical protein